MNNLPSAYRGYETGFLTFGVAIVRQTYSVITSTLNRFVDLTTDYTRQRIFSTDSTRQRLLQETIQSVNTTSPLPETAHTITSGATNLEVTQTVTQVVTNLLPIPGPTNPTGSQLMNTVTLDQLGIPINAPVVSTFPIPLPIVTPSSIPEVIGKFATLNTLIPSILPLLTPAAAVSAVKGALFLLPPLLYALYKSEEENLYNINTTIDATPQQKTLEIGFGREGDGHLSIAFTVKAGHPFRDLKIKNPDLIEDAIPEVFLAQSSIERFNPIGDFLSSMLSKIIHVPGLNLFILRRQKYHAECNITINDPMLQDGPIRSFIKLSENEKFKITQQNPASPKKYDYTLPAESSNFVNFETCSVKITDPISPAEEHRTQKIPLPFSNDGSYYLQVTQRMA